MRACLLAALCALLASCAAPPPDEDQPPSRQAEPARSADNAPQPQLSPARSVATLAGHWRVAGIDGAPFDEPYGLALAADDRELWWDPRCAGIAWRYSIYGDRLTVASPDPEPNAGSETPAVKIACPIGLPSRLRDVEAAIAAATRVERTPENGILISGGGRSLLLFSQ